MTTRKPEIRKDFLFFPHERPGGRVPGGRCQKLQGRRRRPARPATSDQRSQPHTLLTLTHKRRASLQNTWRSAGPELPFCTRRSLGMDNHDSIIHPIYPRPRQSVWPRSASSGPGIVCVSPMLCIGSYEMELCVDASLCCLTRES